jgi:hypothetical protein
LFSQVELPWEELGYARFLSRLASFSHLIPIDARGTGLSDRAPLPPPMEEQVDDVLAVLDICLRRKWKGTGRGSELGRSGREWVDYPLGSLLGSSFCGVLQKVV